MRSSIDQQRFVLAVGDAVDRFEDSSEVKVLSRLDRVVLVEASHQTAVQIRHQPGLTVHIFEREIDARRAFGLFLH
ncbi:MAG: hypothetical protein ACE14W_11630 [Candidatus Velamenicoccus archaeovorus]